MKSSSHEEGVIHHKTKAIRVTILYERECCDLFSCKSLEALFKDMSMLTVSVKVVDINDDMMARKLHDLVVIPGGEPMRLFKTLGKNNRTILKQYLSRGGRIVGICAGACVIHYMNLLPKDITLLNDNIWAGSGLAGKVSVMLTDNGKETENNTYALYYNCPLFKLRVKKNSKISNCPNPYEDICITSYYKSDVVQIQLERIAELSENLPPNSWICCCCTHQNTDNTKSKSKSKCSACGEKKNHKLPPINEMPGSIASIAFDNVYAISFHPEFSDDEIRLWFEQEMVKFTSSV